jgi:Flp pilus assembly protein TadD
MTRSLRFGTALSALALASLLPGCATGDRKGLARTAAGAPAKVGTAMRAQMAVEQGNFAAAVGLAEQAVQANPGQPLVRAVLGNAYFGSGRFASAEAAFRDSLSLAPGQPAVVLKLALARIAQGKSAEALAALETARENLEPADYGLAVALAGQPAAAVAVLDQAARLPGADARLRQNLALAHALSGDWTMARTIAAQDVAPEQLDTRIQQWMTMATPARASDQVAVLTGIRPAFDPGQPVHLALNRSPAAPHLALSSPQPQPVAAFAAPPQPVAAFAALPPAPQLVAAAEPEPVTYVVPRPRPNPQPQVAEAAYRPPAPVTAVAESAPEPEAVNVTQVLVEPVADRKAVPAPIPARFDAKPRISRLVAPKPARARGNSRAVVQLGAFGSPERVAAAWNQFAARYGALNRYTPVSARFDSARGVVYRLSVKGFASAREAQRLCGSLQSKGGNCFVRQVAGDSPVRFASR